MSTVPVPASTTSGWGVTPSGSSERYGFLVMLAAYPTAYVRRPVPSVGVRG